MHVLTGGHVVDVDGVREADVAIEDGEIVAVGDVDRGETETDVSGCYVAPGLIDAHVHLTLDARPNLATARDESDFTTSFRAGENIRDAVRAGVTTVRDLGSRRTLALDAADLVEEGVIEGPRILAAGQAVVMTGGHGNWFGREADGPHEVRKAAREQLKRGADVVKCMATGGVLTEGALTGAPELTPAELDALVDAAEAKHVPTAAHCHGAGGIKNAVRAGISSVEHGTFMDREAAELMAEQRTYWVPTASALHGIVEHGIDSGIPESAVEKAEDAAERFESAWEHALEAEVPIAMGTDAGTPFNHFADIPNELTHMVEYGLTPQEALEAATVNAADLLDIEQVGKVEPNYTADLVVLADDPTETVETWQDPIAVFARGSRIETAG